MPSCLLTPKWTKTAELRFTFTYVCKNKQSSLRLWLTLQSPSMNLEPELVSSSQCQCTLDFHSEAFGLCVWVLLSYPEKGTNFINTENHCYFLILIYNNGSDNQNLIKHCVLCNDGTGKVFKVFNGHKAFHIQTELFTWAYWE